LAGLACATAAGAAYALTPRRSVSLLGATKLDDVTPRTVGPWLSQDISDLVPPSTAGSLAAKLYGATVERVYVQGTSGAQILMLLAHGEVQSNALQLHRPEECYPAFGFRITQQRPTALPIARGVLLPARMVVAEAAGRRESIFYWTRLGEFLPMSGGEQRIARIRTAMEGVVADGLLARFSVVGPDPASSFALLTGFVPAFVRSVASDKRAIFVGTHVARALAGTV
jgi:EpsI family protein